MKEVGRNDPCPCGSGKKYKKCCAQKSLLQRRKFTAVTPTRPVEGSVQRIAGMLSKDPPAEPPKALDEKVKKQGES